MTMTTSRLTVALTSLALVLGACSGEEAPDADAIASSPTAEATEESESPAPEPESEQEPEEADTAEPSPEASPSPCPEGQQRLTPGSSCFEPSPASEPDPEPEPTQEETAQPEPEPEPEPVSNPCDDRGEQDHGVTAVNFDYDRPSIADVCSGDTVTLTVAEGSHSFTVSGAEGDTGVFGTSEGSRTTTVSGSPGTYQFRCTLHPNQMSGQIELIG